MPENPTTPPEHGATDNRRIPPPPQFGQGGFGTRCPQCHQPTVVDSDGMITTGCRHRVVGQRYGKG